MPKKKTKEEYIEELKIKAPNIELVGDYINARTKTLHHCIVHDIFWSVTPDNVLRGQGCKQCGKEKYRIKRLKPKEQYIEELKDKNSTLLLIGEYIDSHTPTQHYCSAHNVFFDIRPYDALYGKGCKRCGVDKISAALMKTTEEYVNELFVKNPTLQLVGEYNGTNTPTAHRCLLHDVVWDIQPSNALYGEGCEYCKKEKIANSLRKPEDEYIIELSDKNPDIKLTGLYVNYNTPVEHYCNKHHIFFNISPLSALNGSGCKRCGSEKIRAALLKSEEEYINELKEVNPDIILVEKYVGADVHTLHKCLICKNEWSPLPNSLLQGCGCPNCRQSKGERKVKLWLEKHNLNSIPQKKFNDCRDKNPLPFDFYLNDYNICIEYQGMQHYNVIDYFGGQKSLEYTQAHDKIKSDYCNANGIRLICIPYWEDVDEYLNKNLLI